MVYWVGNKYFLTTKELLLNPQLVALSYINSTRKKYVAPFTYLAIATTITALLYNYFEEDLKALITSSLNLADYGTYKSNPDLLKKVEKFNESTYSNMIKYFNIVTFLFIPI